MIYTFKATGCENKVLAIKGVRQITGMGLKESKELVEEAMEGKIKTLNARQYKFEGTKKISTLDDVKTGIEWVRDAGCTINPKTSAECRKELKKLIKHAVEQDQFTLATDLMEVYKNHFGE